MARSFFRLAAGAASLAALSLAAAPLAAASNSAPLFSKERASSVTGAQTLDWRGNRHRHRDRGGIDGGEILAGVLILGGIAAIASAASNDKERKREEAERYRDDYPYPDERPVYQERTSYSGGGIDNAVNLCTDQVERGNDRVAAVDNASRTTDGWRISGQLDAGGTFNCWIDNDGRIRNVDLGGGYSEGANYDDRPYYEGTAADGQASGQWDDDAYASARTQVGYAAP
jgi:hypothetical protein